MVPLATSFDFCFFVLFFDFLFFYPQATHSLDLCYQAIPDLAHGCHWFSFTVVDDSNDFASGSPDPKVLHS